MEREEEVGKETDGVKERMDTEKIKQENKTRIGALEHPVLWAVP